MYVNMLRIFYFILFPAMVSYNVIIGDTVTKFVLWLGGEGNYKHCPTLK